MTLPIWTTNPYTALSTSEIEGEFGGTAPTSLSEYYRNGTSGYVTGDRVGFPGGVSTPIPVFGNPLAIGNFYGASAVSYTITTNKTAYNEGETMSISVTAPAADGSTLYWTIEDATTNITISPTTLPTGIKGGYSNEPYQPVQLTASGGTAPYTFSIIVGSLPPGFTLSSSGSLSGTPTSAGVTTFTVQAIDSQGNGGVREYSLSVANVTYSPTSLPNGTQGSAYSQQITVSGGVTPYNFELLGTLPAGLSLSSTGLLSGTPTATGTFNTSMRVSFNGGSMGGPGITITYSNWVINAAAAVTISVSPSSLPTGAINASYSQQLTASGGTSPYTYSTSSSLPSGVTLSSSGLLSGTPTVSGSFNLVIQVNDSASHSNNVNYTLDISSVNISISPSSLPAATQNSAFSQQLSASGGTSPYTYSAVGQLPPGLSLTSGGLLAGTPTSSGPFGLTIVATDANTNTGSKTYSLQVSAAATGPSALNLLVNRGGTSQGSGSTVLEIDNPAYIGIQIYVVYPSGHVFNPGAYDRVSWAITGTGITTADFAGMTLYSGPTNDNDVVTINPLTSLSGTIDCKYFPAGLGNSNLGVIYIYVANDGISEAVETFTFTVTFGGLTTSDYLYLRDY